MLQKLLQKAKPSASNCNNLQLLYDAKPSVITFVNSLYAVVLACHPAKIRLK